MATYILKKDFPNNKSPLVCGFFIYTTLSFVYSYDSFNLTPMLTQQELSEIYKNFDDGKIVNLAKFESKKLTQEAILILKNEISSRNLNANLINWIDHERNFYIGSELEILKAKIKTSKCSNCKILKNDIKGFYIHNCSLTHNPKEANLIFCETCGNKMRIKNYVLSGTFGWFSTKGIIKVPFYFFGELADSLFRKKQSEKIINEFVFENTGTIRMNGTDNISKIIELHNENQLNAKTKEYDPFFELLMNYF
jgi:hypothetical protein